MAAGSKTNQHDTLVRARLSQSSSCHSFLHREHKTVKRTIDHREKQESKLILVRNINLLQQDIYRIFDESLHCDLKIIHGYKIIQTHQCIIRIRSPWFYNFLRPYFLYRHKIAHCYIREFGIYLQLENFVRLLYTNLDISHYERYLIQIFLNASCLFSNNICETSQRESTYDKAYSYYMNCCSLGNVAAQGVNDKSPTSSDMADSGLETGSMISPQETISENSSTDLDEPNESVYHKKSDEILKICGETRSTVCNPHDQKDSSREVNEIKDGISDFENRVLTDPFYDSNPESDDEDEAHSYVPTRSLKAPSSVALSTTNGKTNDDLFLRRDKITQNGKKPNITIEQHIDINVNSSSPSNYYFIDASSLNDDLDITTTNVVGYPNDLNGRSTWSNPQLPGGCFLPSSRSNNLFHNDDSFKHTNRKTMNSQNQCEEVAEFEQELKLSKYLEPFTEPRKVKKLDSSHLLQEDLNCKSANKESLVVEIKEADSGESAQHSPCPDNTKVDNVQKVQNKLSNIEVEEELVVATELVETNEEEDVKEEGKELEEQDIERRPSLIRRNTFELDANDEKLSSLRQEYERRQGSLVFQNSITQYSQHLIDGDPFNFDTPGQSNPDIINNLGTADSQVPPAPICDLVPDKYGLDTVEKEDKSNDLLSSHVDDESANYSIARSSSDKLLANYDDDEDLSFSSLPVNINDELSVNQVKSKLRRNEAAPIVSGGVSSTDFKKPTDSPIIKRKTESTPIVSGGSVIIPEPQAKPKAKVKMANLSSSMSAWVVDMSDCRTTASSSSTSSVSNEKQLPSRKSKDSPPAMSASFSPSTSLDKDKDKDKSQHSSLGYFVNLEDIKSPRERTKAANGNHKRRPSDTVSEKNYCEFFVDLSETTTTTTNTKPNTVSTPVASKRVIEPTTSAAMTTSQPSDSKKNMFSMFIDLNEVEVSTVRTSVAKSHSSSKLADKRYDLTRRDSQEQQQLPSEEKKPKSGVFMFIESGSPVVRRRTLSSSRPAFKRHSWNTDKSNEQSDKTDKQSPESAMTAANEQANLAARRVHKRAHSLSVDRVGDFRKLFGHRTSSSSHSLNEAAAGKIDKLESKHVEQEQERPELEEGIDYDVRDTPPNSHVEIMNEELLVSLKNRNYQELDAINEQTMNEPTTKPAQQDECCSESSVWDKTPTESTETNQARKSETFDISSSASGPSSSSDNLDFKLADLIDATQNKLSVTSKKTGKNHQDTKLGLRNNDELVKNNSTKHVPPVSFVRLSDLDKRPLSTSANINLLANACQENFYRLSNSVTETSWIESKLVMSARSSNEPSHRTIGKKLPLSIATGLAKSDHFDDISTEGDAEAVISESDISSLQSSMGRSGQGSTEETETSTSFAMGKPYNRLGEDLLRMFLEEINPDVTIDVGGRRIRAHKCILSSRCQYFAAILSGSWIENAGNIISLQGYSYNAVHFALCHIYSGESCIPDTISIVELATLADMLCLEGLKEVIGFTLKVKYCHLFHKPCNGCAVGVLECMPLAAAYGLDEVYRKSLRWVTRHFVRIWPCKEFATLPRELMDRCYHQHIVHMSVDNVLQTLMDCDKLLTTLPNVRWAEPVFRLVSNLLDASMKYLTDNFTGVLGNETFQSLDRELTWDIGRLEDHLLAAAERLAPEQACKSYSKLDKMIIFMHSDDPQTAKLKLTSIFMELINKIRGQVEKCLVRDAARAARTNAWLKMDLELRRRIQELACLVILPNETTTKRPSRHSNFLKEPKERLEPKPTLSRTPPNRNLDLRKVKMAISEHNDKMLKQTPLLQTRKVMNKPKTDPLERKSQNDKLLPNDMSTVSRPKSWPNKIEVKSRYLEPRTRITPKEPMLQANQDKSFGQRRKIMISSSDSSRTSSPAMKRAAEKKALTKMSKVPMKKDGKALSSDSLNESKLSIKKDPASKSCGITRPESPSLKVREIGSGLSIDSLADPKKKPLLKKPNKMDTSMSTDSLMTDITNITTPKSATTNKSSPILGKTVANINLNSTRSYEKLKKSSPPSQQRNTPSATRRPARSLESSTAASRSRAAAVVNTYHGSLNLRKSLLDAAKAPDIPSKTLSSVAMTRTSLRQSTQSMRSSFAGSNKTDKIEKKDESAVNNQRSSSSPASKRSPKSNISSRLTKSTIVSSKQKTNKVEDKSSNKVKSQTTGNADGPKFLNQSSRSGTFLKDEPTILKKADIETAAIDV